MNDFVFVLTLIGVAASWVLILVCRPGSTGRSAATALLIVLHVYAVSTLLSHLLT